MSIEEILKSLESAVESLKFHIGQFGDSRYAEGRAEGLKKAIEVINSTTITARWSSEDKELAESMTLVWDMIKPRILTSLTFPQTGQQLCPECNNPISTGFAETYGHKATCSEATLGDKENK